MKEKTHRMFNDKFATAERICDAYCKLHYESEHKITRILSMHISTEAKVQKLKELMNQIALEAAYLERVKILD